MPYLTGVGFGKTVGIQMPAGDIGGGVVGVLKAYRRWTLYISGTPADQIRVELSPDGGTTWYEIEESPLVLNANGIVSKEFGYDAGHIRLTNITSTDDTAAQVRGVL